VLEAGTRRRFRSPEEGTRPLLEAAMKQRLVEASETENTSLVNESDLCRVVTSCISVQRIQISIQTR
jgi:hypothetical protein